MHAGPDQGSGADYAGHDPHRQAQRNGIPAPLLNHYLAEHGITPEKTSNFSILFLFSIGVTKGKWGSLVNALLDFKRDYDANTPLARALPQLCAIHPAAYGAMGLKDLGSAMFAAMKATGYPERLQEAYNFLPQPEMIPAEAHDRLIRGEGGMATLSALAGGVAATAIVPYPPGIPLLMPGRRVLGLLTGRCCAIWRRWRISTEASPASRMIRTGWSWEKAGIRLCGTEAAGSNAPCYPPCPLSPA